MKDEIADLQFDAWRYAMLQTGTLLGMTPFMERKDTGMTINAQALRLIRSFSQYKMWPYPAPKKEKKNMVKIDWSKVNKQVKWLAMDKNGTWWGYFGIPYMDTVDKRWLCKYGCMPIRYPREIISEVDIEWANDTRWEQTLTERPKDEEVMTKKHLVPGYHVVMYRNGRTGDVRMNNFGVTTVMGDVNDDLTNRGSQGREYDVVAIFELKDPVWTRSEKQELESEIKATENKLIEMKAKFYAMK